MTSEFEIDNAFKSKKIFFDKGNTKTYGFRITQLKKLKKSISKYEKRVIEALSKDMHKPEMEAYMSEIGVLYEEISYTVTNLKSWMKPHSQRTPLVLHPSLSKVYAEPLGIILIIGPWNYPFQLLMAPLIGAIAAGNCAILKPSDNTKNTAAVIEEMIKETFDEDYISVVTGPGAMVGPQLIEKYPFNHIFFTGSPNVGKQVMAMASKHLTPVTLELGGKSPVIVDKSANLDIAAKRITWAKFFNAGQTCVAPDYMLVHEDVKDEIVSKLKECIKDFYNENPAESEHYTHIVNLKRFNTIVDYLKGVNIIHGGQFDSANRFIAPTLVDSIPEDHPLLHEEIFGPILPIITFKETQEIITYIRKNRYPLACYIFSKNTKFDKQIIEQIEFGGGCINNTLVHLANPNLPFGGVGNSGMGQYHGKYSFEVFSHYKSILRTSNLVDPSLRYPPYTNSKLRWAKRFFE
ncbi:MAG: aldehyde dehydrogenase [Tenuifilaceae bacterium]